MQEGERRAKAASGVELRLGELMQESRAGWRRGGERGGISGSQRFKRRWNGDGGGEVVVELWEEGKGVAGDGNSAISFY
ncbi:hypothetical protein Tsubulata_013114 [Turnera subulata]|uniref:Uncharacterized protein n=1 Tax=Turnera subulata TaxID=218843 RepID=A0A9Q0FB28_9ROSI|nr:hypothetical protein Tsubulata_013114 [Turnera subulata]